MTIYSNTHIHIWPYTLKPINHLSVSMVGVYFCYQEMFLNLDIHLSVHFHLWWVDVFLILWEHPKGQSIHININHKIALSIKQSFLKQFFCFPMSRLILCISAIFHQFRLIHPSIISIITTKLNYGFTPCVHLCPHGITNYPDAPGW